MVLYRLDEVLLTVLVGLLCRAEDLDEIEDMGNALLDWFRRILPFENAIAPAQTLRRTLARLDPRRLEEAFAAWTARLAQRVHGVIGVDGKSVRGSKKDALGTGALHLVSAYAHQAGLVLAQRAVDTKSNEITAIPELLDMLSLEGAIVPIDAMGTQTEIASKVVAKKADYVLALKGNQGVLHQDVAQSFADPALAIEERTVRAADAQWLAALNLLRREPSKLSLKRKRLKATISPEFRNTLLAINES